MKGNQGYCHFVMATNDNKLKQNIQAMLAGRPPEGLEHYWYISNVSLDTWSKLITVQCE